MKNLIKLLTVMLAFMSFSVFAAVSLNDVQKSSQKTKSNSANTQSPNYDNLWKQIAHDFSLNHHANRAEVQKQIKWFQKNPDYIKKIGKYGKYYMYYVYHEVKRRNLPTELVLLPMIESAYDPFAYSWVGAAGIWQMMPQTGASFGLKHDWWYDGRKAIKPETRAALDYLTYIDSFFNGNWLLAIGAYNAGEGTVQSAVNRNAKRGLATNFWKLHLPKETENYVPKLLGLAAIVQNPKKYGVDLPYIPNKPYFGEALLDKQIELSKAAKMANIPLDELYELNPGYTRWATDPDGPFQLLLPVDAISTFEENLAKQEGITALVWRHHIVKHGDTLKSLAEKYHTSKEAIKKVNHLKTNTLKHGKAILIPSNVKDADAPEDETPNPEQKKSKKHSFLRYKVKPGDSLWAIANKHHMTLSQLARINHLTVYSTIKAGDYLYIYQSYTMNQYYKVKPGDSLSSIASKVGVKVTTLAHKNHLNAHSILHPGDKLLY